MKKLNLSGKDLRRIGFEDDQAISIAKNLLEKHYKHHKKADVLELLSDFLDQPDKYENHEVLGKLAAYMKRPKKQKPAEISLHSAPIHYPVYGAQEIDEATLQQMNTAMRLPIALKGALMPDAHHGYGLPIGGVMATRNEIIPFAVGMDIGCRMCLTVYDIPVNYFKAEQSRLIKLLEKNTRFGRKELSDIHDHPILQRTEFREIPFLRSLLTKARQQLGTSGSGNHFVDMGILRIDQKTDKLGNLEPGKYFAILSHSGSRNMGAEIAKHYTSIAKEKCILPKGASQLAWLNLDTEEGTEYWKAMNLAGDYSASNHELIHKSLAKALGEKPVLTIENHHNFAWKEKLDDGSEAIVHRKGATPAHPGQTAIIPGSMTTHAYIVEGLGEPESIYSASHGAGRLMSRAQAKKSFSKKDLRDNLEKADVILLGGSIDEASMAYKNIDHIMKYQDKLVKTLAVFSPRIVRMSSS